jgi:hypothetical protein
MARRVRFPKSLGEKLRALDDHLFLLRTSLEELLKGEPAHLKVVAAELRTLVCRSDQTEGLLWRLADELNVSDEVFLCEGGRINRDHPLARSLRFFGGRNFRGERGPDRLPRVSESLRYVFKTWEAIYVPTLSDVEITHEYLIKAVAQQIGSAHEDNGIEPILCRLREVFLGETEPCANVLVFDADLTLQIGERVLDAAESQKGYRRRDRAPPAGELTIVVRLGIRETLAGRIQIFTARSLISEVEIRIALGPGCIALTGKKRGVEKCDLRLPYPDQTDDFVFAVCYSSGLRCMRTLLNGEEPRPVSDCDLGWMEAQQTELVEFGENLAHFLRHWEFLMYRRLLSRWECGELLRIPVQNLRSILTPRAEPKGFPD